MNSVRGKIDSNLKSRFNPAAIFYCLVYFLIHMIFLGWDLIYQMPKMVNVAIKGEEYIYTSENGSTQYFSDTEFSEFVLNSLAYLRVILAAFGISLLLKKNCLLERMLCCCLFVIFIYMFTTDTFTTAQIEIARLPVLIKCVGGVLLIRVIWKLWQNKSSKKRNIFPYAFISGILLAIILGYISFLKQRYQLRDLFSTCIKASEYDFSNLELEGKLLDFSKKYNFSLEKIFIFSSPFNQAFTLTPFFIKDYAEIYLSTSTIENYDADKIMGVLGHEIGHSNTIAFISLFSTSCIMSFILIYFVERVLLSNIKNYNMNDFAMILMKMILWMRLVSILFNLCETMLESFADENAFSEVDTCLGLASYFNHGIKVRSEMGYTFDELKIAYKHYSPFKKYIPSLMRLMKAGRKCDVSVKEFY